MTLKATGFVYLHFDNLTLFTITCHSVSVTHSSSKNTEKYFDILASYASIPLILLLDFTGLYDSTIIKKMVGSFVLKQFIVYDMRNFSHFTEVVLDRPAFGDSDAEFAEAIEEFLTMYSARITVICEGLIETGPLFTTLLNRGVSVMVNSLEIQSASLDEDEYLAPENEDDDSLYLGYFCCLRKDGFWDSYDDIFDTVNLDVPDLEAQMYRVLAKYADEQNLSFFTQNKQNSTKNCIVEKDLER